MKQKTPFGEFFVCPKIKPQVTPGAFILYPENSDIK